MGDGFLPNAEDVGDGGLGIAGLMGVDGTAAEGFEEFVGAGATVGNVEGHASPSDRAGEGRATGPQLSGENALNVIL